MSIITQPFDQVNIASDLRTFLHHDLLPFLTKVILVIKAIVKSFSKMK